MEIFSCLDDAGRAEGVAAAVSAVANRHLVILPTDTGYALVGDAFSSASASRIRAIKGMAETAPLQVLISDAAVLDGVASPASQEARSLADAFWPGPLSLIVPASPTVQWDIGGDSRYVQVRVPDHPVARELLKLSGPLVASAARAAQEPLVEEVDGIKSLQHHVAVFLDCGTLKSGALSTIVDCTSETDNVAILRKGPISVGQIVDVLNYMPRLPESS